MRLFIGIKLDNKASIMLDKIQSLLYSEGITGNYTLKENLHMTLVFLGEVSNSKVNEIIDIINSVDSSNLNNITSSNIEVLKEMLILKINKSNELNNIYLDIINKLKCKGYKIDDKEYFPHITLVRKFSKEFNKPIIVNSSFTKITLFESIRINGVLKYIPLN